MPRNILVGYATRYGSTRDTAETLAAALRGRGLSADVRPLRDVNTLAGYGAAVIGAPLYLFLWHADARRFLSRRRKELAGISVAVFALGPTHVPHDEEEWRDSRRQLDRELARHPGFSPAAVKIFGGKYDPAMLRFPVKWLAGDVPASDVRDEAAIRAWAGELKPILVSAIE